MIKLAQYKHQKVMNAYANLDNLSNSQCIQILAEIEWLLKNGKKFATNQVAFEKKLNSIKNALDAKILNQQEGVTM